MASILETEVNIRTIDILLLIALVFLFHLQVKAENCSITFFLCHMNDNLQNLKLMDSS